MASKRLVNLVFNEFEASTNVSFYMWFLNCVLEIVLNVLHEGFSDVVY